MKPTSSNKIALWLSPFFLCVAWGFPFLAYKVTFPYNSPLMLCAVRFILAGVVIGFFVLFSPRLHPSKSELWHVFFIEKIQGKARANHLIVIDEVEHQSLLLRP